MPNKQHLLQPNLQSNHIEVRLIIVRLCTELQDPENNFPKESKPKKLLTNNYLVTPFLNNVSFFEFFCSFKVGCSTTIKDASRFLFCYYP